MKTNAMDQEVVGLLNERHTPRWMKSVLDGVFVDLEKQHRGADLTMNDVISAFVCAMLKEREFFLSEFSIRY